MNARNFEIDGIRGWAALSVLLFHFYYETFGIIFPIFREKAFSFILDGHLMVLIFFVLSGDALSSSFFKSSQTTTTVRIALARYFRLTFLISISCGISYLLMLFGLQDNLEAASLVHRENWLGTFLIFDPSFSSVVKYMLYGVYFEHARDTSYNPFLWTMSVELLGSLLIFINIFVSSTLSSRSQITILIVEFCFLWVFGSYLSLFVIGMALGWLRQTGFFASIQAFKYNFAFTIFFIVLTFYIYPFHERGFYRVASVITLDLVPKNSFEFLYAGFLVFLIYCSVNLVKFFSNNISRFIGRISFPLYVLQFNILVSITSAGILQMNAIGLLNNPIVLIVPTLSVLLTVISAYMVELIELRYLKALNWILITKVIKS